MPTVMNPSTPLPSRPVLSSAEASLILFGENDDPTIFFEN
jgi:hypothetical protein